MANEIPNISQAGITLQVFEINAGEEEGGNAPTIMGGWGVIESSLVALTDSGDNTGEYLIRLSKPGSGVPALLPPTGTTPRRYSSLSQLVLWSGYFQSEEFEPALEGSWVCDLVPDPDGPAPVVGKTISLPFLRMRMMNEDELDAENGVVCVQVNQIPQG